MTEDEWFQGHDVDPRPRPVVLAWWIWAAVIAAVLALASFQARGAEVAFDCRQLAEDRRLEI